MYVIPYGFDKSIETSLNFDIDWKRNPNQSIIFVIKRLFYRSNYIYVLQKQNKPHISVRFIEIHNILCFNIRGYWKIRAFFFSCIDE